MFSFLLMCACEEHIKTFTTQFSPKAFLIHNKLLYGAHTRVIYYNIIGLSFLKKSYDGYKCDSGTVFSASQKATHDAVEHTMSVRAPLLLLLLYMFESREVALRLFRLCLYVR